MVCRGCGCGTGIFIWMVPLNESAVGGLFSRPAPVAAGLISSEPCASVGNAGAGSRRRSKVTNSQPSLPEEASVGFRLAAHCPPSSLVTLYSHLGISAFTSGCVGRVACTLNAASEINSSAQPNKRSDMVSPLTVERQEMEFLLRINLIVQYQGSNCMIG